MRRMSKAATRPPTPAAPPPRASPPPKARTPTEEQQAPVSPKQAFKQNKNRYL